MLVRHEAHSKMTEAMSEGSMRWRYSGAMIFNEAIHC